MDLVKLMFAASVITILIAVLLALALSVILTKNIGSATSVMITSEPIQTIAHNITIP
jgi:hypothetical protein